MILAIKLMKKPHYPAFPALEKKTLFTHVDGFFA
ncbi:hypothetical protein SAG0136_07815 [Streptococcus agalactiae LMG 14747]|nr:hypothetical protein SAG0136_07815 [Streptococcus agalactiae LMG 14747]